MKHRIQISHHILYQLNVFFIVTSLFFSCVSPSFVPPIYSVSEIEEKGLSRLICSKGILTAEQLQFFFIKENPRADGEKVLRLAKYYVKEARDEGVNSDIAFVQMCLETGFLRFGGLVTEDMNNFCGLGAISQAEPGLRFPSEELGVRAHIQHLHAYGCTSELVKENIDPRYKWVLPRGKASSIYGLAGTWASDPAYGEKLDTLLLRLENFNN